MNETPEAPEAPAPSPAETQWKEKHSQAMALLEELVVLTLRLPDRGRFRNASRLANIAQSLAQEGGKQLADFQQSVVVGGNENEFIGAVGYDMMMPARGRDPHDHGQEQARLLQGLILTLEPYLKGQAKQAEATARAQRATEARELMGMISSAREELPDVGPIRQRVHTITAEMASEAAPASESEADADDDSEAAGPELHAGGLPAPTQALGGTWPP